MTLKEKQYELLNTRKAALDAAKALVLEGKANGEEHKAKAAEVEALNGQIEAVNALILEEEKNYAAAAPDFRNVPGGVEPGKPKGAEAVKAFAQAAREGFPATKSMNEGSNEDGGYTVPEDIVTRVETLRNAKASLRQLVGVENVSTNKGRRTFKKRAQQVGFSKVAEGGKIPKTASPQFEILNYSISKYAGFMPVTNELMEDSDENITAAMTEWLADEARVTDNKLILEAIKKNAAVALSGLDGIRKALLVTLGSAFLPTSEIITNDDGLFWLSTLKDANGRDLLAPNPADPARMQLSVGATVVPVHPFPNADLPSSGTKVPFVLGDLTEGIRLFDRQSLTMLSSNVAVAGDFNAYEQDMTLTRAILREDVQQRDAAAYIYGEVDTAPAASAAFSVEGGGEVSAYTEAQLNAKKKDELLAIAAERGVTSVTAANTNVEIIAAILGA